MTPTADFSVCEPAKRLYEEKLKAILEPTHRGEFLAIEPVSGEYVLDDTLSGICRSSRNSFPNRMTYIMRIGFASAVEIGYSD